MTSAGFAVRLLAVGKARSVRAVRGVARRAAGAVSDVEGLEGEAKDDVVLVRGGFSAGDDGRLRWPGAWVRELLR